ncbi:MAG: type II secretion system F family protein [Lawsonibacter sp.]|nr:type II secretion system F family protein [Lawsonibacter sp.]
MKKHQLSNDEISGLCLELSLLLHAGVNFGDGLALMAEEESQSSSHDFLLHMAQQADDGASLANVFQTSGRFPNYVCALLAVGERSGRTEESLTALAQYYESRTQLDCRLRTALLYPAVLLLILLIVIVVLLVRVLPVFNDVYSDLGGHLTGVAGALFLLGCFLDQIMPILLVLLGLMFLFLALFSLSPSFRSLLLCWWRTHWGDHGISRKINTARFAQSLAMGLSSGLPLEEALSLSSHLLEDVPSARVRFQDCLSKLEQGTPLAKAMGESGVLPRTQSRLLDLGLRSGSGDSVMEQIAQRLFAESETALEEKIGQVEPTLVVITSVLVGLILLSVMLPLMHIMTAIG